MALVALKLRPGVNTEATALLNEGGWSESENIRFFESIPQKDGGFKFFTRTIAGAGKPLAMRAWTALSSIAFLAIACAHRLNIFSGGFIADITPNTISALIPISLTTTVGSTTVQINDIANSPGIGEWLQIRDPVTVSNIALLGSYGVISSVPGTSYSIATAVEAADTVLAGGHARRFSTMLGSQVVNIYLPHHGLFNGEAISIPDGVTVGGVTLIDNYLATVVDVDNYTITAATAATSTTFVFENSNQIQLTIFDPGPGGIETSALNAGGTNYLAGDTGIVSGGGNGDAAYVVDTVNSTTGAVLTYTLLFPGSGYVTAVGVATAAITGESGAGFTIDITMVSTSGGSQVDLNVETATMANWGEFLMWCPRDGPVYVWMPAAGIGTQAKDITTAPQSNRSIFVATQEEILFCCGTVNAANGLFDPMLVAWSDAGDYTDFVPTVENQAGSFRLSSGSEVVGAIALAGGNLIWTDLTLYSAQYLQPPLVWGFQPIGVNCGLIGPHAFGTLDQQVFWMSDNSFYFLSGGTPKQLFCTIWDRVFKKLDRASLIEVVCETNSFFNEVSWEVPQTDGTVVRARIHVQTGEWSYTVLPSGASTPRTAWADQSIFGPPLGADALGNVYRHDDGNDADGEPLLWRLRTGDILIAEGDDISFIREVKPDFKFTSDGRPGPGVVEMLMYVHKSDPQQPPTVKGPFPITSRTRTVPGMRGRGFAIQFEFRGRDLDSFCRLGSIHYRVSPDGRQ
jgi:hypothetical protein